MNNLLVVVLRTFLTSARFVTAVMDILEILCLNATPLKLWQFCSLHFSHDKTISRWTFLSGVYVQGKVKYHTQRENM